jgi:uncharacterized protein YndB with AHSA1/START domain
MPDILHTLPIQGKARTVYRALTTQDGLRAWFTRYTMAEPVIGAVNRFGFAGQVQFEMRVEALEPDEAVEWSCISGHPEWAGTRLAFRIARHPDRKDAVLLHFAHRGWKSAEGFFPHCAYDWAQYLRSLKLYIEQGKGTPS